MISYSSNESKALGLKIGRCNAENFNEEALFQAIAAEKYDLCRLKIPAEDEWAAYKLDSLGFPSFFSGSIRRYHTPISDNLNTDFINPSLVFEEYDGTQDEVFKKLLKDTWGTYPIGYYRTPIVTEYVDKEIEIDSVYQFYKNQNLSKTNPNNSMMFMKDKGEYVAFFAINIIGDRLESHIGGVYSKFRKKGYFLDKLLYIKRFCLNHKLKYFAFGARNENALVQRLFHQANFTPIGTENVFHIVPFLSYNEESIKKTPITFKENNFSAIQEELLSHCKTINKLKNRSLGFKTIKMTSIELRKEYLLQLVPLSSSSQLNYTLFRVYDKEGILVLVAYMSY